MNRTRTVRRIVGRPVALIGIGIVALAFVHPPHGTGLPLCTFRAASGLPCPGCGMTRSVSCAVRGDLADSLAYHPFGLILLATLLAAIVINILPGGRRRAVWRKGIRWSRGLQCAYLAIIACFVLFGTTRFALAAFEQYFGTHL